MGLSKQSFALYIQILSSLFLERDIWQYGTANYWNSHGW